MTPFINQYKLLFVLSWIILYIIYPAWALPISVTARACVFSGLIIYFCIAALLMNRWLHSLNIDKPVILLNINWRGKAKDNIWLVIVCFSAVVLHIYPLFYRILIIGDETIHLQNGLLIYEYIDSSWHIFIQIIFWVLVVLFILIRKWKAICNLKSNRLINRFKGTTKSNFPQYLFVSLIIVFLVTYFLLLQNITYYPSLTRYPPASKLLYFFAYSAFGINQIFPRIIQLIFYLLCAIYLYRTINLFHEQETALLGATIYLFLPVVFAYAHLGELVSGTIFFVVAISFYFIRFIKDGDERDLLLAVYLIGIGFMYKKPIMLMFFVCFAFLAASILKKNTMLTLRHLKVLLLSLIIIFPWMIISKYFTWRNYTFQLSNFTSFDGKVFTYIPLIQSNMSAFMFALFVLSVIYLLFFRRTVLTIYFALLFIVYYFIITSDVGSLSPRFSMFFYPSITVFLSLFISRAIKLTKWRHAFKLIYIALTVYLITICTVFPLNMQFLRIMNKKLHYFPVEKAMKWVKDNVNHDENVLALRILPLKFYSYKYGIARDNIIEMVYGIEEVSTPERLSSFNKKHNISYIIFPYSHEYINDNIRVGIFEHLKNNLDRGYIEVAKYNQDENIIYIYKLKES